MAGADLLIFSGELYLSDYTAVAESVDPRVVASLKMVAEEKNGPSFQKISLQPDRSAGPTLTDEDATAIPRGLVLCVIWNQYQTQNTKISNCQKSCVLIR